MASEMQVTTLQDMVTVKNYFSQPYHKSQHICFFLITIITNCQTQVPENRTFPYLD